MPPGKRYAMDVARPLASIVAVEVLKPDWTALKVKMPVGIAPPTVEATWAVRMKV